LDSIPKLSAGAAGRVQRFARDIAAFGHRY
jgi:hypothetical protein